jgi:hypothetical protein
LKRGEGVGNGRVDRRHFGGSSSGVKATRAQQQSSHHRPSNNKTKKYKESKKLEKNHVLQTQRLFEQFLLSVFQSFDIRLPLFKTTNREKKFLTFFVFRCRKGCASSFVHEPETALQGGMSLRIFFLFFLFFSLFVLCHLLVSCVLIVLVSTERTVIEKILRFVRLAWADVFVSVIFFFFSLQHLAEFSHPDKEKREADDALDSSKSKKIMKKPIVLVSPNKDLGEPFPDPFTVHDDYGEGSFFLRRKQEKHFFFPSFRVFRNSSLHVGGVANDAVSGLHQRQARMVQKGASGPDFGQMEKGADVVGCGCWFSFCQKFANQEMKDQGVHASQVEFIIAELQDEAKTSSASLAAAPVDGVYQSDAIIPEELR